MPEEISLQCPWCGERFRTVADTSAGSAEYVEDCPVCCQPIRIGFDATAGGEPESLRAERDD